MRGFSGITLGLALVLWFDTVHSQANEEAIADCQALTSVCGSKKNYDGAACKKLAKDLPTCGERSEPGTVCRLSLSAITPTQLSVGLRAAQCKANELKRREDHQKFKKGLTRYLLKPNRLVPTVLGPDAESPADLRFYITDHHHLSYALYLTATEAGKSLDEYHVFACIIADKRRADLPYFWAFMVRNHFAWLDDNKGEAIEIETLQGLKDLADLKDYPFRTWSRWVRESCGYLKYGNDCLGKRPAKSELKKAGVKYPPPYFMEFRWADYLEQNLKGAQPLDAMDDAAIQAKLTEALALAQGGQAYLEELPGYNDPQRPIFPVHPVTIVGGCEAESAGD